MKPTFDRNNWQQALIETNLLIIGFNAWNGYLKTGRGVVVCTTNSPLLDRFGETFKTQHHMNGHILDAVDKYNPEQDLILLLESGTRVSFFYLKNLPITPPECYQKVKQAWSEFQLPTNHQHFSKI